MPTFALTTPDDSAETEPETARDPRIDPRPGDVLAYAFDVREVFARVGGRIEYGFPRKAATRWLDLIGWQAWARRALVHKVAP